MDFMTSNNGNSLISPFLKVDLVVQTQQTPGVVSFENYEQLKACIAEGVSYYEGFEYTPNTYRIALEHYEQLKYVKNVLQKTKRDIVKNYNAPLEVVEKRLDELLEMIKRPFKKVESFVKENEKNAKKYEIYVFAEDLAKSNGLQAHAESILNSPAFFDQRWLNASCSKQKWRAEVLSKIKNAVKDIAAIQSMEEERVAATLAYYYQTLSMERVEEFVRSLRQASSASNAERGESVSNAAVVTDIPTSNFESAPTQKILSCPLSDAEILNCVADSVNPYTGEIITGIDDCLKGKLKEIANGLGNSSPIPVGGGKKKPKRKWEDGLRVGKRWTEEEENQLVEEFKCGLSIAEIAQIHNRKSGGVFIRLRTLGLIKDETQGE